VAEQRQEIDQLRRYLVAHLTAIKVSLTERNLEVLDSTSKCLEEKQDALKKSIDESQLQIREVAQEVKSHGIIIQNNQSVLQVLLRLVTYDLLSSLNQTTKYVQQTW
jgi:hypothetical protein